MKYIKYKEDFDDDYNFDFDYDFDNNNGMTNQIIFGKKQGYWKYYYRDGKLKECGTYKDDKKYGIWETYYDNGTKSCEQRYVNDLREGYYKSYLFNNLFEEGYFINDERYGLWKIHRTDKVINYNFFNTDLKKKWLKITKQEFKKIDNIISNNYEQRLKEIPKLNPSDEEKYF